MVRPFGLVFLQSTFPNDQSTFSNKCDTARFCLGEGYSASRNYFICMNKQQDGATSESSSNSTQYLIFGLNFRLLNIYLSCKLVVTCASSQYWQYWQYWQFCLFQDFRKYFQSSAFNLTILPFSTFGQLWNFHKVWLF